MENNISKFAVAFIAAQKKMIDAIKDSDNPYFKSKYADLNSVRKACVPALNNEGIAVLQPIVQVDGKNFIKTLLLHESGESMESLTEIVFAKQNDAQAQGSGITYARRYGLQSLVSLGAEDDDGNKASENRNAHGLSSDSELSEGIDMKEIFEAQALKDFATIKKELEACTTLVGLEVSWKKWTKELNGFKKYNKVRYDLLEECKDVMKTELHDSSMLDDIGR